MMSTRMRDLLTGGFGQLRHEPTAKRIRVLDGGTVVDTTRALLVWEPSRVMPSYAAPGEDITADQVLADMAAAYAMAARGAPRPELSGRPLLDASVPFAMHTAEGHAADLSADGQNRPEPDSIPPTPTWSGMSCRTSGAFDAWYEEDELNVAHPRDPFHSIYVLPSSRRIRLELDGHVLAESSRPALLFETMLPARYYLPDLPQTRRAPRQSPGLPRPNP